MAQPYSLYTEKSLRYFWVKFLTLFLLPFTSNPTHPLNTGEIRPCEELCQSGSASAELSCKRHHSPTAPPAPETARNLRKTTFPSQDTD